MAVPLVKGGTLVAGLWLHNSSPRHWSDDEIALVTEVGERTWAAVERARAEAALRESEGRLRNVLDGMGEAFGLMDHELRIITQNKAALELDGRPLDEIRGRSHWEVYPGTEDSEIGNLYRRALAEQVPVSLEHRYEWPGGGVNWLEMRAFPVPEGLAVFWRDITSRKESEAALRASEAKFRGLFEVMSEGYVLAEVIHDDEGTPVDAIYLEGNPSAARLTGVPEFNRRLLSDAMPGAEEYWLEIYDRVLRTGVAERREQFASVLGRWYDFSVSPIDAGEDEKHAPRRLAIVFTDPPSASAPNKRCARARRGRPSFSN
jgi:PAS domain S-box-containing protein